MNRATLTQLFFFIVAGAVAFVVDAGVLYAMLGIGTGYYAGRAVSFVCASLTAWYLNRRLTFAPTAGSMLVEWLRYFFYNLGGGAVNYGSYVLCLHINPIFTTYPILAVGVGSATGLIVNFALNKFFVFK